MKMAVLFGILAMLMLILGCSEESYTPEADTALSAGDISISIMEFDESVSQCYIDSMDCSRPKVTEKNIQFTINNDFGRDIMVHSIKFDGVNCGIIADKNIFLDSKETFIVPCSLKAGNDFSSRFTVKYTAGDGMITRHGALYSEIEREN
jgi:hypothetical protein